MSNLLIIVEGPDGSGKSTLVRSLVSVLGLHPHHTGGPIRSKGEMITRLAGVSQAVESHPAGVILDRHPAISDEIYKSVSGDPLAMNQDMLDGYLLDARPLIVFCGLESMSEMWRMIDRTNKPHKPPSHLDQVLRDYKKVVEGYRASELKWKNLLGDRVRHYNWINESATNLARWVEAVCAD